MAVSSDFKDRWVRQKRSQPTKGLSGEPSSSSHSSFYKAEKSREYDNACSISRGSMPSQASETPSAPPLYVFDGEETRRSSVTVSSFRNKLPQESSSKCTDQPTVQQPARVHPEPLRLKNMSGQAGYLAVLAYEACVRLCLNAWSRRCLEAPVFLQDECSLLRMSFGLHQLLLQPKSLAALQDDADSSSTTRPKSNTGTVKVQVRKLKLVMRTSQHRSSVSDSVVSRCSNASFDLRSLKNIRFLPRQSAHLNTMKHLLKAGVDTLRSTAASELQDSYSCHLKLKSSSDSEAVQVQGGNAACFIFHPESSSDDLVVDVFNSRGVLLGRATVQLSDTTLNDGWWPLICDGSCTGKVQLRITYTASDHCSMKAPLRETSAYDVVLDAAMRTQHFGRGNLRLKEPWTWILSEFADYYGVSNAYTKLRYVACIMDGVAAPTKDCLSLILELLIPVFKARSDNSLTRQEKVIFVDVQEQVAQLVASVFTNYKSLDESSVSGYSEIFSVACGTAAPALKPAVELFTLMNDMLSPESQELLRSYIQTAARKRCKRYMENSDEYVVSNIEEFLADPQYVSTAYMKMKQLCLNVLSEIMTDIDIHYQHVLPSSIDLPNITAAIYNVEVCSRLQKFLVACPPSGPSSPVADLIISADKFQKDLAAWNVSNVKGGVNAKEIFHSYILSWIQEKRETLIDMCKLDKVRLSGVTTDHGTAPFVEEVYGRLKDTLAEYDVILTRWPEYTFLLETTVVEVEGDVIKALEKYYAEVLLPLRESSPAKFMQKLRRKTLQTYSVPNQLGVVLNTIKRLLDTLRPAIDLQMRSWATCTSEQVFGERLKEVTVTLRTKYRSFGQAVVDKLADNAGVQSGTKLKRILQETRTSNEQALRKRMQELCVQVEETISHLHEVFQKRVFVEICRGYWDRMAKDLLQCLESTKESRSLYRPAIFALAVIDETFTTQLQTLESHSLPESDLEPPRSVLDARSILSSGCSQDIF